MPSNEPSDLCIVLAALSSRGGLSADEIAGRLARLGWPRYSAQKVASWLRRIEKLDAPPIKSEKLWGGYHEYTVTPFGETWIHNELGDIWWAQARAHDRIKRVAATA